MEFSVRAEKLVKQKTSSEKKKVDLTADNAAVDNFPILHVGRNPLHLPYTEDM